MLGSDKSRGYCLEMICADFLAGAATEENQAEVLLLSLERPYKTLRDELQRDSEALAGWKELHARHKRSGIAGDEGRHSKTVWVAPNEVKIAKLNELRQVVKIVDSEADLLRTVEATPGAVGILDVYSINSSVKVLRVDGKLPFDLGYALKGN